MPVGDLSIGAWFPQRMPQFNGVGKAAMPLKKALDGLDER
jgi:hypothetical protein